jgi:glutamate-1-semialdehyde 2,1-aminomutase
LVETGFGTAFALHFTQRGSLNNYRDALEDDHELLDRYLLAALAQGINILPDGRLYVSTAHSQRDADETVSATGRAFRSLLGIALFLHPKDVVRSEKIRRDNRGHVGQG